MDIKIMIADDDQVFRQLMCDIVRKEGLIPVEAVDGEQAIKVFFEANDIDLMILDVMMPGHDGWEVLKAIREYSDVPVIMLTALGDEKHEVQGLRRGADDYIAKPFSYEIFKARLNSLLRKVKKERLATLVYGEMVVNQEAQRVSIGNDEVDLSRKEYTLLTYFMKNKNRVLTRDMILSAVWGYDFDGDARTIDTHIKTLRAKLAQCGSYIKTVRGSGYIFEVNGHEDH